MKTQLRPVPHSVLPDQIVVELWHDGRFIGALYGADGRGVRLVTKHGVEFTSEPTGPGMPNCHEILIDD